MRTFNTDKFLDLVENHHIKGHLYSSDCQNFCLVGSVYVGYDLFDFENKDVKVGAPTFIGSSEFYKTLETTIREHVGVDYIEIATFNDSEVPHEEIVEVAKEAVERYNNP